MLLEKGLIRPLTSPWGSAVLFVLEPGGKRRVCIDFRALKNATTKNGIPLPRIQDCLDALGGAFYISKLDLVSGYWQLLVNSQDVHNKTAFNTRDEFLVMPFGLTNARATLKALMNNVLRDLENVVVILG